MSLSKKISVCPYEVDSGGIATGSRNGPRVLKEQGLFAKLEALNYDVREASAVSESNLKPKKVSGDEQNIKNAPLLYAACQQIGEVSKREFESQRTPLVLGGDHSVSIGSIAGISAALKTESLGLLWIDTHPDINTPQSSPSKSLFGMSVAALVGAFSGSFSSIANNLARGSNESAISPENLVYIGLRDVDAGEKKLIRSLGIKTFTMRDIDVLGMYQVAKQSIEYLRARTCGIAVSFDLDVCDPRLVPGTGTPYRGGLNFREAHLLAEVIHESRLMLGLEVVELNPILDKDFETARLALSLIESFFGDKIL